MLSTNGDAGGKGLAPPPSLGRLLNFSAGATNRLCRSMLAEHELQLAQWVVLSALWRVDGLSVGELARYSGNEVPAASRIVDRMEAGGLVRRRPDADDGRAVRVWLTRAGRSLDGLASFYEHVNERLLSGFTETEAATLFALLERVLENARRAAAAADADADAAER